MKIEKLRNNYKKKIIKGGLIVVGILSAIVLTSTRAKYRTTQSINIANGTITYKPYDLNLVAMFQENEAGNGWDSVNIAPTSGYKLNTTESACKVNDVKDTSITISYSDGKVAIGNLTKKGTKCSLYFDKMPPAKDTILAKLTVKETTPTYSSAATTDEGVYKIADGMYNGDSYVWRGAVKNNWIKFAGFYWRIIRINGDGTIRMIYQGKEAGGPQITGTGTQISTSAYNSNYNRTEYAGYTYKIGYQRPNDTTSGTEMASTIKGIVDTWYNNNIGNNTTYASKVADGKFCNDKDTGSTWSSQPYTFYYKTNGRLLSSKAPVLSCPSKDVYTLKVGLISADEVMMAGAINSENSNYYLYTNQYYWTMSPCYWYSDSWASGAVYMFYVYAAGNLGYNQVNGAYGVRPVINLNSDTVFVDGGKGTVTEPYIVE